MELMGSRTCIRGMEYGVRSRQLEKKKEKKTSTVTDVRPGRAYQAMWNGPVGCVSGVLEGSISGTLCRTLRAIEESHSAGCPPHLQWMPRKEAKVMTWMEKGGVGRELGKLGE